MNSETYADLINDCLDLMDNGYSCGEAASEISDQHGLTDAQTDDIMWAAERDWYDQNADIVREDRDAINFM